MNDILFDIVRVLVAALFAAIARYLIPWLRTKLMGSKYTLAATIIENLVLCVEQTFGGGGNGPAKYDEVVNMAKRIFDDYGIDLTEEQISALIEAAVYSMNANIISVDTEDSEEDE